MANITKNLTPSEQVVKKVRNVFCERVQVEPNKLLAMTFEPRLEQTLISRVCRSQFDIGLVMDPSLTEGIIMILNQNKRND